MGTYTHDDGPPGQAGVGLMYWWRTVPTWLWMAAAAFAIGALIALS
jgi:hypothetical protein